MIHFESSLGTLEGSGALNMLVTLVGMEDVEECYSALIWTKNYFFRINWPLILICFISHLHCSKI